MMTTYRIDSGQLVPSETDEASIFVYSQPSELERSQLLHDSALDPLDLEAIYDPDEVPRIEALPDATLLIWKLPSNLSGTESAQLEVSSIGVIFNSRKAIVVVPRSELSIAGREFKTVSSPHDFVLRVLLHVIHHYQGHLKGIKMMSRELQSKIITSMENKYLLQMFTLGESLVYYYNALEADSGILAKLRATCDRLGFTAAETNFLDDAIIENQQAAKQASIYSTVLSGLMDARGTIINNNMNVLLKNLTIINVVFLPLNLIASIGGMSEFSVATQGIDWRISYSVLSLAMVALAFVTWWWLVKVVDRGQSRNA